MKVIIGLLAAELVLAVLMLAVIGTMIVMEVISTMRRRREYDYEGEPYQDEDD